MDQATADLERRTTIVDLNEDILLKIFSLVENAGDLVRAMSACKAWQRTASLVPCVSAVIEDVSTSYEAKISAIYSRFRSFSRLEKAHVIIGRPRCEEDHTLRRCMRYAEVGIAVDKFLFLAAKTGEHNIFYGNGLSKPGDTPEDRPSEGLVAGYQDQSSSSVTDVGGEGSAGQATHCISSKPPIQLPLKHVLGPTDHSLKMMMPVIVFAIIRGFDDLLQVLPRLVKRFIFLQSLLVVDLSDNVTLFVREHHMKQLRDAPSSFIRTMKSVSAEMMDSAGFSLEAPPRESSDENARSSHEEATIPVSGRDPDSGTVAEPPEDLVLSENCEVPASDMTRETVISESIPTSGGMSEENPSSGGGEEDVGPPLNGSAQDLMEARERRRAKTLEISRSSDLDISFWRADEASIGRWKLRDVSACIASHGAVPLSDEELDVLANAAFGGFLLEATINLVNSSRGTKIL